eukprot:gene9009-10567_t
MQDLNQLVTLFANASSSNSKVRDDSTQAIKDFVKTDGALLSILKLVESSQIDLNIRVLASIIFKNHIKENWRQNDTTETPINRNDKNQIKAVIVNLMLLVPSSVQAQLLEALTAIGESEFPSDWSNLLPELVARLKSTSDYNVINSVLQVINSLFRRYRHQSKSNSILTELKYILEIFPQPYLELFVKTGAVIKDTPNLTPDQLKLLFTSVDIQLEIFLSLSSVDLPEFFEDNMALFAAEFQRYLTYQSNVPTLVQSRNEEDPSLLNQVQSRICEIVSLYAELYDEEFGQYLQPFVESIWGLLTKTTQDMSNDSLLYSAVKFLSIVSMSVKHQIFGDPNILKQICSSIVTPNIKLREADLELFEDNPIEYIRRDIEGSDSDTRRRSSIELVKSLRKYFESQVTQLLSVDINQLLAAYQADSTANWLSKDAAIFLVTALAVKSDKQDSNQLVPVLEFFHSQVVPELQNAANVEPILVADCLKFIMIFRSQIPTEQYPAVLELVINCLSNPNYIVHTYASSCVDRLLAEKINGVPRIPVELVIEALPNLLQPLVKIFDFQCSRQNERTMRAIVRIVLMVIGKVNLSMTVDLLRRFTDIIMVEAANPTNHSFDHYCFEVIGSLLKSYAAQPEVFSIIMPLIQFVLSKDVVEFSPYVFQLLSILVENANQEFFGTYREMLPMLYHPSLWKRTSNIPALVRLIQAYFKKDGLYIAQNNHLEPILGVFQQLIASPANDHEGFYLIESIIEYLPLAQYERHVKTIFQIVIGRISTRKTDKVVRCFIVFLGLFIFRNNVENAINYANQAREGLWNDIISKVWIPTVGHVTGVIEKKIVSIAMTQMLCSPAMFGSYQESWIAIADCQAKLLTDQDAAAALAANDDAELYIDIENVDGYVPTFTQLQFTKKQDTDPIVQINNARLYFAEHFRPIYLANRQAIDNLCQRYSGNPHFGFYVRIAPHLTDLTHLEIHDFIPLRALRMYLELPNLVKLITTIQ